MENVKDAIVKDWTTYVIVTFLYLLGYFCWTCLLRKGHLTANVTTRIPTRQQVYSTLFEPSIIGSYSLQKRYDVDGGKDYVYPHVFGLLTFCPPFKTINVYWDDGSRIKSLSEMSKYTLSELMYTETSIFCSKYFLYMILVALHRLYSQNLLLLLLFSGEHIKRKTASEHYVVESTNSRNGETLVNRCKKGTIIFQLPLEDDTDVIFTFYMRKKSLTIHTICSKTKKILLLDEWSKL